MENQQAFWNMSAKMQSRSALERIKHLMNFIHRCPREQQKQGARCMACGVRSARQDRCWRYDVRLSVAEPGA